MRILFIADEHPWGPTYGYRIRIQNLLRALVTIGEVDLFVAAPDDGSVTQRPVGDIGLARTSIVAVGARGPLPVRALRWVTSGLPRRVATRDWKHARSALEAWVRPHYDVIWYSHVDPFAGLGEVTAGRVVVDLDNLEEQTLRLARVAGVAPGEGHARQGGLRGLVTRVVADVDQRRWRRLERRAAGRADAVVVCSDLDRERLGSPNAHVVVNGYEAPALPPPPGDRRPVVVMFGRLTYPPNADGARYFVEEILPALRRAVPDVELRLVGRSGPELDDLARHPGVSVLGQLDDIDDHLAAARLVVVPLRVGSGTRIKVIEAFACRIPVVSTTLGCEGIAVESGRHLLVADEPDAFAAACARVLTDEPLREHLVASAAALHADRYGLDRVRADVVDLIGAIAATSAESGR